MATSDTQRKSSIRSIPSSWPTRSSSASSSNAGKPRLDVCWNTRPRSKVKASRAAEKIVAEQKELEQAASKLEQSGNVKNARRALQSDDIVYRYAGLRVLSEKDPKAIVESAASD